METTSKRIGRFAWDPAWPQALAFLAPNFIGFLCFTLLPVILSFIMAFHHWTLRPAEAVHFVGLRNFVDLLGVRAVGEASDSVSLILYLLCSVFLMLGLVGSLVSNVNDWKGARIGGGLIALTGLGLVAGSGGEGLFGFWLSESGQGTMLAGVLALVCGGAVLNREDAAWDVGLGLVPGALITTAVLGFWVLHEPMWSAYEPTDPRFWYYFYNTIYLMMGLPVAIGGALSLALLLNERLPFGAGRARYMGAMVCGLLALLCVVLGFGIGWPNVGVLAAIDDVHHRCRQ